MTKKRDFQREYEREKTISKRFNLKVQKELGRKFADKLKANNMNFSEWVRQHMINYINGE